MAERILLDQDELAYGKEEEEQDTIKVVIKTTSCELNLREEPSMTANIIRKLRKGEEVEVQENLGEWSRLFEGYCKSQYLK